MKRFNHIIVMIATACMFVACQSNNLDSITSGLTLPKTYQIGDSAKVLHDTTSLTLIKQDSLLSKLIDSALARNYDNRMATEQIELARASYKAMKLIRLPELQFNTATSVRKFGDYTMDGVGNYDTKFSPNLTSKQQVPNPLPDYYFGFQTAWEVDVWGRLNARKRATLYRLQAQQASKHYLTTQLVAQVSMGYFEWMALNQQLAIVRNNLVLQEAAYETVQKQKENGRASELAVELLWAQVLASRTMEVEVKEKRQLCGALLANLCGTLPTSFALDTLMFKPELAKPAITVPSMLLNSRADIKQAELELRAAGADVKSARAAFYPNLMIQGNVGFQAFNAALLLESPASLAYQTLGGLTQPIFMRNKLKADLLAAKANQRRAYLNYEKSILNAFTEVYTATNTIYNLSEMVKLKQQEAETIKQAVNTVSELFAAGRATYLEVITVQKSALQSQLDLIEYEKRQQLATVNLYRAVGGGW